MAARIERSINDEVRKRIQTSQLINRLQANALGEIDPELSTGQIKSIETLLRKTIPDLQAITISGDDEAPPIQVLLQGLGSTVDAKFERIRAARIIAPTERTE